MSKSKITGSRFVLAVKDLKKSAEFYEKQLGFKTLWAGEGWHFLGREKFVVMLGECANEQSAFETGDHSYFAYIDVDNIDELYQEYSSKEVDVLSEVSDKPWGQREFSIRTIDGHRIMFGAGDDNKITEERPSTMKLSKLMLSCKSSMLITTILN